MNDERKKEIMALQVQSSIEDADNYRNLLKARTMKALGVEDEIYDAIIANFEKRVEIEARLMVGGS